MIWLQMETCYKARSVVALRGANLNNNNNNNKEEEEEEDESTREFAQSRIRKGEEDE